jgi:cardiolipin synthase
MSSTSSPLSSERWRRQLSVVTGGSFVGGNRVEVLRNGDEIFPAMLDAIAGAVDTVDLVTFVYWSGEIARRFADELSESARRGCRVRILLDAVGARRIDAELVDQMTAAGCDVRWFRPVSDAVPEIGAANHRTHRKILVCDSAVGFTGGVGIADEWNGDARNEDEWRDTHLRIVGPVVAQLHAGFVDNWADQHDDDFFPWEERPHDGSEDGTTPMMVAHGSSATGASEIRRLLLTLIDGASERVRIASAYFNPDDRMSDALCRAVSRGAAVQVLVPGEHADKRLVQMAGEAHYERLLDGGVDLRTYETSMMHAKIVTIDRLIATVGSANFNHRSTRHDAETNTVITDRHVVQVLDDHFTQDFDDAVDLDPGRWAERNALQRAGEQIVSMARRWL